MTSDADDDIRASEIAGQAVASFIATLIVGWSAGFVPALAVGLVVFVGSAVLCWGLT